MKVKTLGALLRCLKAAGVTSYQDADLKLTFGAVEAPAGEPAQDDREMELPEGVLDPRKAIADIYRKQKGERA